ncbi:hypothetical protein Fot_27439 [Forsythia ovata]|uniref:Uncharacterized protein n=1 Tax=Forsythia ovata TaxID=205694 RepID=A0ABD1TLM7_9LAMI
MVARHVAFQSMCGGTALGSSHDDFLGAANHTFLVLPHVATQSLTGGKNLVADETLVNPTARVRQSFKVAGFVPTQSLASGKRPAACITSVRYILVQWRSSNSRRKGVGRIGGWISVGTPTVAREHHENPDNSKIAAISTLFGVDNSLRTSVVDADQVLEI